MKALYKDTYKEIWKSKSRFLSIAIIIALGVCFFSGIKATSPSELTTANTYFKNQDLMDIHLVSTWGFTDADIKALEDTAAVSQVTASYSTDVIVDKGEKRPVFKVMAVPGQGQQNQPLLIEGRMPQTDSECVVEKSKHSEYTGSNYAIGDVITMPEDQGEGKRLFDTLSHNTYTIVGFVQSPLYVSIERGSTSIGSGDIAMYIMVLPQVFKTERFTDVYIKSQKASQELGYSKAYDDAVEALENSLKEVGDQRLKDNYDQIKNDGTLEINKGKRELAEARQTFDTEIAKAQATIADSEAKIADSEAELAKGWEQYRTKMAEGEATLAASKAELESGEEQYAQGLAAFEAGREAYDAGMAQYESLKANEKQLADGLTTLDTTLEGLKAQLKTLTPGTPEYIQLESQITALSEQQKTLAAQLADVQKAIKALDAGTVALKQLEASRAQLDAGWAAYNQGVAQLEEGRQSGAATLEAGETALAQGKEQLAQGKAELETKRAEGEQQLADAQTKIDDAQKQLDDLTLGKWYVFNRNDNPGYTSYGEDAKRIDNLANVFPLFFLLVAVLVSFTTMTRMVEEQRLEIGTLKGLGYSRSQIAFKYVIYAATAAGIGSVVGAIFGVNVLPRLIVSAYSLLYQVPDLIIDIPWGMVIASILGAIAFTVGAAELVTNMELRHAPAQLMRPKAPRVGKRILLERIKFLWTRMGFISKVTARNIFRYKARFLMTVIGIAGCTALILAGFGLQDSIFSIVPRQFEEISIFDGTLGLKEEGTVADKAAFMDRLKKDANMQDAMLVKVSKMNVEPVGGKYSKGAYVSVPSNPKALGDFVVLRHRQRQAAVSLPETGAVITEKMAGDLGIKTGDEIRIYADDTEYTTTVSDIVENYIENYVYLSPEAYQKATGKAPAYNAAYFNLKSTQAADEEAFASRWLSGGDVATISNTTNIVKNSNDTMSSLNVVVIVMLVSAGALAFVVLYNLTNINVSERVREIATIRVLGFYDREVDNYIFRENIVLSLIGMIFGLGLGVVLNGYILNTVETDVVMFPRGIDPTSYLYACLFTMGFTLIVNFVMRPVIRRVDMVESLKSIE